MRWQHEVLAFMLVDRLATLASQCLSHSAGARTGEGSDDLLPLSAALVADAEIREARALVVAELEDIASKPKGEVRAGLAAFLKGARTQLDAACTLLGTPHP